MRSRLKYPAAFGLDHTSRRLSAVDTARNEKNWSRFIFLHERPFRAEALESIDGIPPKQFWPLVGEVWIDTESVRNDLEIWCTIWSRTDPDRVLAMTAEERAQLAELPSKLTVWRGVSHKDAVESLAWTLDRKIAVFFAN